MVLQCVSYGGGVNSTAMLIGMAERGLKPDLIMFADTGAEMPETYAFIEAFEGWLNCTGWTMVTVNNADRDGFHHDSLEDECINNKTLPSLAFGFKGCSVKWKRQPMDRYIKKEWSPAQTAWDKGEKITRLIGIDWGEQHRGKIPDCEKFHYEFPLIEWGWGREECLAAIQRAGLPLPGKSACFFCPAMKKTEIIQFAKDKPDLFARAVALEHNAAENLGSVKGLGRNYTWEELVNGDNAQGRLWPDIDEPCMCFDGSDD